MPAEMPTSDDAADTVLCAIPVTVRTYVELCKVYQTMPNAGVLGCLRMKLPTLNVQDFRDFDCKGIMALVELLENQPEATSHITSADFSRCNIRSSGIINLCRWLQKCKWQSLQLKFNPIGSDGASSLCNALSQSTSLRYVGLKGCGLGPATARCMASMLQNPLKTSSLQELDLQLNSFGFWGTLAVAGASRQGDRKVNILMTGNVDAAEILSAATHFAAMIMALVASGPLLTRAADQGVIHIASSVVFSGGLILLYLCSTLFHSFYRFETLIFKELDQSAVFVLIASTYTPVLAIGMHRHIVWSRYLLAVMWLIALIGLIHISFSSGRWKGKISLALYLSMGWMALVCFPDLQASLPPEGLAWMVAGGLFYTGGVPFFILGGFPATAMAHVMYRRCYNPKHESRSIRLVVTVQEPKKA